MTNSQNYSFDLSMKETLQGKRKVSMQENRSNVVFFHTRKEYERIEK